MANRMEKINIQPNSQKGDKKICSNERTTALIPHAREVLLEVFQKKLEYFLLPQLPEEKAGFWKEEAPGTRSLI